MAETGGWDPRTDIAEVLYDEAAIAQSIQRMADEITAAYAHRYQEDPTWSLTVISVLRGAVLFVGDLVRRIRLPVTLDFMAVASYGSAGRVRIVKDLEEDIEGRDVLVAEDIIDTGLTLGYLIDQLQARRPRSVQVATLLDRSTLRLVHDLPVGFTGFDVGDRFVVGYGLDFRERYRNLPFIGVLRDEVIEQSDRRPRFAHPSEEEFARMLEFYRIHWQYEPRTFILKTDEEGNPEVGFSPDFYLPEYDVYVELTTKKPHLMNRKLRQVEALREQYPDVRIELLDRSDFAMLAKKLKAKA